MGTTAHVVIGGSLTTAQGTKPRDFLDVATAHPTERTGSGRGAETGILGVPGYNEMGVVGIIRAPPKMFVGV